ncbi:ferric-dicitrate binding protein FerR (iron transport regulator) [Chitinophaga terrae (ex Kim and Jung 2007)]|uniref:FecR family protein n=1 Tax=Chitinophaga terrae (ex Kim and Jung 2007) TaxID=408074 RepID=UPI00277F17A3|nr:FecR domain-containing protein [Chitinophaga terrae (ex Kim and Jung 2007)]MDQ0107247.1 ferric-dicitrate binding protein FerR (iron transport regulator) [Chitinophaga terrae (ex Kim and Jung 2007)]
MEKKIRDYGQYTATAFFEDEEFVRHILNRDADAIAYWEQLIQQYPDKRLFMEEARTWILLLNKQPAYMPATDRLQLWDKIKNEIAGYEERRRRYQPLKLIFKWSAAAAAVLFSILILREWTSHGEKTYATTFADHERVILPDESVVTLNGNSSIHFLRSWKSDKPREIWLNGEAYFEVKHVAIKNRLQQSDSFQVHVSDLALTVLGTKFNVRNRRGLTEISLLEGSLRIEKNGPEAFVKILKPGEAFVYDSSRQLLTPMERKPQANKAWTTNELDLDGYSLREILEVLEDNYGYEITLEAPELAGKRLSGTVPAASAEDILFVIRKVFNLKIKRNANHLIISQN